MFRKDIRLEAFYCGMSEAQPASEASITAQDLTAFQQNILTILAEEPRYGLAVKRELEAYYGSEVNHGRLYPNLDDLVDEGLIDKSELDKRTNQYALTDAGHDVILGQIEWVLDRFVTDETRAAEVEAFFET
jgi:DNA-binding PadR family transcriptional regulator